MLAVETITTTLSVIAAVYQKVWQSGLMATKIKFGTSGWRALLADEFTYANVRRAVEGISRYVMKHSPDAVPLLVIGYDPRFLGPEFAQVSAEIAAAHGIHVLLCGDSAPTPAISYAIRQFKAQGGINFTASHNPPEYSGIKFSNSDGAPALPDATSEIEGLIVIADDAPARVPNAPGSIAKVDLRPEYLAELARKVDLDAIKAANMRFVFDPMYGAARGYLDRLLLEAGIDCGTLHNYRDALFGGHAPEPSDEHIAELQTAVLEGGAALGLATDGDADRFGIIDSDGKFIHPNYIIGLLLDYLLESRGWKDVGAGKSVATTNLVNAVAEYWKVPLYETPVGFKYIGELIEQDKVAIGGEESAGLSIRHHLPEKDGVLACLLVAEMTAKRRAPLSVQLKALFAKVGAYYPTRINLRLPEDVKAAFVERLKDDPSEFAGRKVKQSVRTDGLKLVLDDGSWVLFRLSGTEPVCRVYAEARTEAELQPLVEAGKRFALNSL